MFGSNVAWPSGSFKALTRNPEIPSSGPLPVGHAGVHVYSLLVSLPAAGIFNPYKCCVQV